MVGAEGIDSRWKADALMSMANNIRNGMSPQEAADAAKREARSWIEKHNARRPKDVNWKRWEGAVDDTIDTALRYFTQPAVEQPAAPPAAEKPQAPPAAETPLDEAKPTVTVPPHTRSITPAPGTAQRDQYDTQWSQFNAELEVLSDAMDKAEKAYNNAKPYTKKKEALKAKFDKAKEAYYGKLRSEEESPWHKQRRLMFLEDVYDNPADDANKLSALRLIHSELRDQGAMSREQIGATRDVYETLNGMIRDEAKRQGYSDEDAELAVDKIITSIYEFPSSEAKNSLVRRVFNAKDTIQTDKAYRAANDTLDSMKGLDQRAKNRFPEPRRRGH